MDMNAVAVLTGIFGGFVAGVEFMLAVRVYDAGWMAGAILGVAFCVISLAGVGACCMWATRQ